MADFVDIPLGYNIPTQIPLDVKTYVEDEDTLKDLGFGNQKAFKYYKGLIMFCINENTRYEWTEVTPQNDGSGLLLSNYIYPTNHSAFGINYSNKAYNFFNIQFGTVVDGSETKVIQGSNITITGNGTEATPYVVSGPAAASTTYLSAGTNTSVTGDGQLSTPYRVNVTFPPVQDGSETKIQAGTNASISGNGTISTPYIISTPVPTGSETKIQAGSNVTVSGSGTIGSPYIVNSTLPTLNQDNFIKYIEVDGNDGFSENPFPPSRGQLSNYLNNLPNGQKTIDEYSTYRVGLTFSLAPENDFLSNYLPKSHWYSKYYCIYEIINVGKGVLPTITEDNLSLIFYQEIRLSEQNSFGVFVNSENNITIIGDGSYIQPYVISTNNLQKEITTNTTLSDIDNNYVIFINNGTTPITITINTSITKSNFNCGFIQQGTGDVTFVGSGVSLSNPIGLKSKGQGYATFIERKLATSTFYLLGDTKI